MFKTKVWFWGSRNGIIRLHEIRQKNQAKSCFSSGSLHQIFHSCENPPEKNQKKWNKNVIDWHNIVCMSENGHDYTQHNRVKRRRKKTKVKRKHWHTGKDRDVETTVLCFVISFVSQHTRLLLCCLLEWCVERKCASHSWWNEWIKRKKNWKEKKHQHQHCVNCKYSDWQARKKEKTKRIITMDCVFSLSCCAQTFCCL